jgi:hypothetical protein
MERGGTDELSLATRQLQAIDAWNRARRQVETRQDSPGSGRELRSELVNRREVLRREHQALIDRTHAQLQVSGALLRSTAPHRLVVVHQDADFTTRLTRELEGSPLVLSGSANNGAEGIGLAVAEQPDVVLLDDTAPLVPVEDVLADLRRFCPHAGLVVHVSESPRVGDLLRSGATMVLTRRVPTPQVVAHLRSLVLR